jgi:hypothetical protein
MKGLPTLKIIGIYLILALTVLICVQQFWYPSLFEIDHFLNWDAQHYYTIKEKGYFWNLVAFFPLFPMIWRALHVEVFGIIIFNSVLFLAAYAALIRHTGIKNLKEIALYLCIPSFIFFYLPFTESLFFSSSVLMIIGLKKRIYTIVYIGLFLAILSRPAFSILIPALFITEFLSVDKTKRWLRLSIYCVITLLGIFVVTGIHFRDTGAWFTFFSAQKDWGNELGIPQFPLTTWGDGFTLRLDSIAFLVGAIAGFLLLGIILRLKKLTSISLPKEVIFSLAYLGGMTLSVFLFRGGSLFSLNRFVLATPFVIIALSYWINSEYRLKRNHLYYVIFLTTAYFLAFGSYVHILVLLKFLGLSGIIILFFLIKSDRLLLQKWSFIALILITFSLQMITFVRFLNGHWIA